MQLAKSLALLSLQVNEHNESVRLRGMSLFWSQWGAAYWNEDALGRMGHRKVEKKNGALTHGVSLVQGILLGTWAVLEPLEYISILEQGKVKRKPRKPIGCIVFFEAWRLPFFFFWLQRESKRKTAIFWFLGPPRHSHICWVLLRKPPVHFRCSAESGWFGLVVWIRT